MKTMKNGRRYHRTTSEVREAMLADYVAGMTGHAVAKKHGVQPSAVYALLDRRKIPRRRQRHYRDGRSMREGYALVLIDGDPMAQAMANGLCNGRYVLEHRLVMARSLGRPLERHETVHHLNGIRDDNRLENLQLRQGRHGNGTVYTCRDCGSHNVEARQL